MFAIYYCEGKTKIVTKLIGRGGQIVCNIHTPCIIVTSRSRPAEGRPRIKWEMHKMVNIVN